MKNKITLFCAAIIIISAISPLFTSCKRIDDDNIVNKDDLKGSTVSKYIWVDPLPVNELNRMKAFEEETGIKIKNIMVPWETIDTKYILDISTGSAPDMITISDEKWPRYAIKGIAQPIDPFFDKNDEIYKTSDQLGYFKWKGENYAISGDSSPLLLWYNKTMFEQNDVKTPLEYYEEGTWNWDTWRKAGMELTLTPDNDGKEQWGYAGWRFEAIISSNGGSFLDFTDEGTIELALEKKNTMDALQFMQTASFTDKWMKPDGNFTWISDFKAGRLAMFCEGSFVRHMDFKDVSFEMEFVPFPLGSGNDTGYLPGSTSGVGICRGAKNPYGVVEYLKFVEQFNKDNKDESDDPFKKVVSEEQYQLFQELLEIPRQPLFINGVADLQTKQFGLWTEILYNGTPIATAIASQKPVWQGQIDICMQDNKLPEVIPFTPPETIDFEDGIIPDTLVCTDINGNYIGITNAEITSDQTEAISGKSLKVTVDPDESLLMGFRTTEVVEFPAYHSYEIRFDIKTLSDMPEGSAFSVSLKSRDDLIEGQAVGFEEISGLVAGQVKAITAVIDLGIEDDTLCLTMIGLDCPDFVIDNIRITEKK